MADQHVPSPDDLQRQLLEALWAPTLAQGLEALGPGWQGLRAGPAWCRAGLQAYRGHAAATAERALAAAHPTVQALMGEADFAALARALWQVSPPAGGDLGTWGQALPGLIEASPSLSDWPYLADMARLDWACHEAERAPDGVSDADSFHLLGRLEPGQLGLVLAPGCAVLHSPYPVGALWLAHHAPSQATRDAAWAQARAQWAAERPVPGALLVWRRDWQAHCTALPIAAAGFMQALCAGATLAAALHAAPDLDLGNWLAEAIAQGWCLGARACPMSSTETEP